MHRPEKKGLNLCLVAALMAVLFAPLPSYGEGRETINDFASHIVVHRNGSITVTETIAVTAGGDQIKRGIYRDFPTRYKNRMGNVVQVGFSVLGIDRDGAPEPHHMEDLSNGVRIYMGSKDVFLPPGRHTYRIRYETTRQLGFFDDYDELYWNVTGNDWKFPILKAQATVEMPPNAHVLQKDAYTGPFGAKGKDFQFGRDSYGNPRFITTRPLKPGEGLTIAVAWPRGFVERPTAAERTADFFSDNKSFVFSAIALVAVLGYYLGAWRKVGKDPEKGAIIPRFDPPKGISPASARFVMKMAYDHKSFAAAILNLAVKGYLTIKEEKSGEFTLIKTGKLVPGLSKGEKAAAHKLFLSGDRITLKKANHGTIGGAGEALKKALHTEYEKIYFLTNKGHFVPGLILTAAFVLLQVPFGNDVVSGVFLMIWLSGWTFGCAAIGLMVYRAWKSRSFIGAIFVSAFATPFFIGEVFGLYAFTGAVSPAASVTLITLMGVNVLFYQLLKAPTLAGRRVMDALEGLRLYLTVAEKDRLNMLNPPDLTPELFERLLPYALSLDVEQQWSERFAQILAQTKPSDTYRPGWYSGDASLNQLGSTLGGSFAGAVSSSTTAPGSSSRGSGSSGGGSSGGGGGGGGGGGW